MKIHSLELENVRCFASTPRLEFSDFNVLVGGNNAGKSTVLAAIHTIQAGGAPVESLQRLGSAGPASVVMEVTEAPFGKGRVRIEAQVAADHKLVLQIGPPGQQAGTPIKQVQNVRDGHVIVPFLAQREMFGLQGQQLSRDAIDGVQPNFQNLTVRINDLLSSALPESDVYRQACEEILGTVVTSFSQQSSVVLGQRISARESISASVMGSGVPHIAALLLELCTASNKIFLLEEPENALHPHALRALLSLIGKNSGNNQFFVSTHSNIVLTHLGALPSASVFEVTPTRRINNVPTSTCSPVPASTEARVRVMTDLGYALHDFEIYEGWLILEESSAETVINGLVVPKFCPFLAGRIRTVSARGNSRVSPLFDDFQRLFLYAHLESRYRGRCWVVVDGDTEGQRIVAQLRNEYQATWDPSHFKTWSMPSFEDYYPDHFRGEVEALKSLTGPELGEAKGALALEVTKWGLASELNEQAFAKSATHVIATIREIEAGLGISDT